MSSNHAPIKQPASLSETNEIDPSNSSCSATPIEAQSKENLVVVPSHGDSRNSQRSISPLSFRSARSISPLPRPPKPTTWFQRCKTSLYENRGLLLILCSQFFGSLMSLTTRILETEFEEKYSAVQILFARQSITMCGCMAWLWWNKVPEPFGKKGVRALLVARGLGGFFGVYGLYYSLNYLDLADATVITFLAPILATYICSIIPSLREPFTRTEIIAGVTSFLGVVLIARPTTLFQSGKETEGAGSGVGLDPETPALLKRLVLEGAERVVTPHQRLVAVLVALLGVLGAASAYTTIRWIGTRAHPLISVNYFSTWCTIVSTTVLLFVPSLGGFVWPRGLIQWLLLIGIGVSGFCMQFLLTSGLQLEKAGRGTNMVYTQMLFALTWERIFWGVSPGFLSILGSILILGSAMWVGLKKHKKSEVKDDGHRLQRLRDEETGLVAGRESVDGGIGTASVAADLVVVGEDEDTVPETTSGNEELEVRGRAMA